MATAKLAAAAATETLDDRYELGDVLGEGAFGIVTRATHRASGSTVAIKTLKEPFHSWTSVLALREVAALRKLIHPHIVRLRDVMRDGTTAALVFEFLPHNLFEILKNLSREKASVVAARWPEARVRHVMFQLAHALSHTHASGFLHRDLKPENVLMDEAGGDICKLADYGLAREPPGAGAAASYARAAAAGAAPGSAAAAAASASAAAAARPLTGYVSTRWYRAPELLLGDPAYGAAADVWAFACILAELVTARPLFAGSSDGDQLFKISSVLGSPSAATWPAGLALAAAAGAPLPHCVAIPLSSLLPAAASPELVDLLQRCLAWDPRARLTSAQVTQHSWFRAARLPALPQLPTPLWDACVDAAEPKAPASASAAAPATATALGAPSHLQLQLPHGPLYHPQPPSGASSAGSSPSSARRTLLPPGPQALSLMGDPPAPLAVGVGVGAGGPLFDISDAGEEAEEDDEEFLDSIGMAPRPGAATAATAARAVGTGTSAGASAGSLAASSADSAHEGGRAAHSPRHQGLTAPPSAAVSRAPSLHAPPGVGTLSLAGVPGAASGASVSPRHGASVSPRHGALLSPFAATASAGGYLLPATGMPAGLPGAGAGAGAAGGAAAGAGGVGTAGCEFQPHASFGAPPPSSSASASVSVSGASTPRHSFVYAAAAAQPNFPLAIPFAAAAHELVGPQEVHPSLLRSSLGSLTPHAAPASAATSPTFLPAPTAAAPGPLGLGAPALGGVALTPGSRSRLSLSASTSPFVNLRSLALGATASAAASAAAGVPTSPPPLALTTALGSEGRGSRSSLNGAAQLGSPANLRGPLDRPASETSSSDAIPPEYPRRPQPPAAPAGGPGPGTGSVSGSGSHVPRRRLTDASAVSPTAMAALGALAPSQGDGTRPSPGLGVRTFSLPLSVTSSRPDDGPGPGAGAAAPVPVAGGLPSWLAGADAPAHHGLAGSSSSHFLLGVPTVATSSAAQAPSGSGPNGLDSRRGSISSLKQQQQLNRLHSASNAGPAPAAGAAPPASFSGLGHGTGSYGPLVGFSHSQGFPMSSPTQMRSLHSPTGPMPAASAGPGQAPLYGAGAASGSPSSNRATVPAASRSEDDDSLMSLLNQQSPQAPQRAAGGAGAGASAVTGRRAPSLSVGGAPQPQSMITGGSAVSVSGPPSAGRRSALGAAGGRSLI
jgi:protein kinase